MNQNKEVVVVMPFHKEIMDNFERICFINNCEKLKQYPLFLVLPEGADPNYFKSLVSEIQVVFFDKFYFDTYFGSNQLWIRPIIYDYFKQYKYILKCELDAFVIKDDLNRWIGLGYDYVGAPWIDKPDYEKILLSIIHSKSKVLKAIKKRISRKIFKKEIWVGNGGFSLRKVSSFRILSRIMPFLVPDLKNSTIQEDVFWALYVSSYVPIFQIPDYKIALEFSFETNPAECFKINQNELPFGCHAWWKKDMNFWIPFINNHSVIKY